MPRIRNIKPDFFLSENVGELKIMTRLFFIGLWTQADKDGRLEDRPKKLRVQLFPYDEGDVAGVEMMLKELDARFITRYQVDGEAYIQINGFKKHQRPHVTERESKIPLIPKGYNANNTLTTRSTTVKQPCNNVWEGEGEGEGERERIRSSAPAVRLGDFTPIQRVVNAYKEAKGVGMEDKGWDRANFSRYTKAAKSLIECLNGWEPAAVYVIGKGQEFDDKNLDWTLETIKKHAWDNRGKLNAGAQPKMGVDPVLGPRRNKRTSRARKQIIHSGEIVARGALDGLQQDGGKIRD